MIPPLNFAIADRSVQIADALADRVGREHPIEANYAHTPEDLRDCLRKRKIDVLLINADFVVETGVNLVSAIRRLEYGFEANPFLIVAAIVHDRHKTHVPAVLEAGVDCGLLVPTPIETMANALLGTIEHRRKWVIVPPYIGPDRRPPRDGNAADPTLVKVPNTALAKIQGDTDALVEDLSALPALMDRVEDTSITAIQGRLGRLADQINELSVDDMVMMLPSIRTQMAHDLGLLASIPRNRMHRRKGKDLLKLQQGMLHAIPTTGADPATLARLQAATNEMAKSLRGLPL